MPWTDKDCMCDKSRIKTVCVYIGLHNISKNYLYRNNSICNICSAERCDKLHLFQVPSICVT